jgi:hypothetical protein
MGGIVRTRPLLSDRPRVFSDNSIRAAASAGKQMILTLDLPSLVEESPQHVQLDGAETLASGGGCANRAVILDQPITPVR